MAWWRAICYANSNNCASRDETSFEITSITMGRCNYPNNYTSCDEVRLEITNIVMDVVAIQVIVLVMMKQFPKSLASHYTHNADSTHSHNAKL
jgi:hypothetical protein